MIKTLLILTILTTLNACSLTVSGGYRADNRRHYIIKNQYSKSDTLHLSQYILFGVEDRSTLMGGLDYLVIEKNGDSVSTLFKESFTELNEIKIDFSDSLINHSNPHFHKHFFPMKFRNFDLDSIINLTHKTSKKVEIIPVIRKQYTKFRGMASVSYGDFDHVCHYSLAIFLIQNREIIYYKQLRWVESINALEHPEHNYYDYHIPITQERWNSLVLEVMRDYIERLK